MGRDRERGSWKGDPRKRDGPAGGKEGQETEGLGAS